MPAAPAVLDSHALLGVLPRRGERSEHSRPSRQGRYCRPPASDDGRELRRGEIDPAQKKMERQHGIRLRTY
jgi:hypothetical protein